MNPYPHELQYGDVYISHTTGGIMKSVGGTAPFVTLIAQSNSVTTMPVANPTSAQDEPSEVTVKAPRGLDIIKPAGSNIELLVYTDKTGHCVNMIDLTNNVSVPACTDNVHRYSDVVHMLA